MQRALLLILLVIVSSSVHAQRFNQKKVYEGIREKQWEAGLLMAYQNSSSSSFDDGSSLDTGSKMGWGFAAGYNLTPHWNFGFRFSMAKPGYSATIVPEDPEMPPQTIDYTMSRYSGQLNATWNWFRGPLTPFLQAGVGWTKLDSNIINRPPTTGCWWDPWWGYICSTTWTTYDTRKFSYNMGLGLRWDLNPAMYLRGSYNREFLDVKRGSLDFDSFTLEAGLMW